MERPIRPTIVMRHERTKNHKVGLSSIAIFIPALTNDYTDLAIMLFGMICERPRDGRLKLDPH
jgi:hypothetical protein